MSTWTKATTTRGTRTAPSNIVKYKRAKTAKKDGGEGREMCVLLLTPDLAEKAGIVDHSKVEVLYDTEKKAVKLKVIQPAEPVEGQEVAEAASGTSVRQFGNWLRVVLNNVPKEVLPETSKEDFVPLVAGRTRDQNAFVFSLQ